MHQIKRDNHYLKQKRDKLKYYAEKIENAKQEEPKLKTLKELEALCLEKKRDAVHSLCIGRNSANKYIASIPEAYGIRKRIGKVKNNELDVVEAKTLLLGLIHKILQTVNEGDKMFKNEDDVKKYRESFINKKKGKQL